jgi:hypothetical protein
MSLNSPTTAQIEHINISVANPDEIAERLCNIFSWEIRWSGPSMDGGRTVHVGSKGESSSYFALYSPRNIQSMSHGHEFNLNLNHVGIVVDNLEHTQELVAQHGFEAENHRDYGVCKSFYFYIDKNLEIEVVEYK